MSGALRIARGVLVTGATLPLGRRLIDALLARGHGPILAVGLESAGGFPEAVTYHSVDLSRSRAVKALIDGPVVELGIDTVVHLAHHRRPDSARAHKLHVDATRLLLRLSEDHPTVRRFVQRSTVEVYATRRDRPDLLREDHPLELSGRGGSWVAQQVEADLTVCTRMGMTALDVVVLRCAEILAPDMGSQLHDYLQSRVCLRPLGFDPMVNLLSLEDAARAFALAVDSHGSGVYNIPGADTLPLIWATRKYGRDSIGLPDPLLGPLYRWRRAVRKTQFRYELNAWRFHFNGVLDGSRAARDLGYRPQVPLVWPCPEVSGVGRADPPPAGDQR